MFIGILVGTLCLFGLARAVFGYRRGYGHHFRHAYYGGGYGGGYDGGYGACGGGFRGGPPWRGGGRGGRGLVWSLLARLDATPSQEKTILSAVDELKETARNLRGTARETRGDLARTVRAESFDESALQSAGARLDQAASQLRGAVAAALSKVHGVLDDRQRKILGDIIDAGRAGC